MQCVHTNKKGANTNCNQLEKDERAQNLCGQRHTNQIQPNNEKLKNSKKSTPHQDLKFRLDVKST